MEVALLRTLCCGASLGITCSNTMHQTNAYHFEIGVCREDGVQNRIEDRGNIAPGQ